MTDDADDRRPVEHRLTFERDALTVQVRVRAVGADAEVLVELDPPLFVAIELEVQCGTEGVERADPSPPGPGETPPGAGPGPTRFRTASAIVRVHILGAPGSEHLRSEWFRV